MRLSYIKRLAEITSQCLAHGELYCIVKALEKEYPPYRGEEDEENIAPVRGDVTK